jgi:hypothetical protein
MALPTYLELVNEVLTELREDEVTSVSQTTLSRLIGRFVNKAKRKVEDSYNWNALTSTAALTTVQGTFSYTITDSGARFKVIEAFNITDGVVLYPKSTYQMNKLLLTDTSQGMPSHYNFNGIDTNGDTKVDLYPIPDATERTIYFNLYVPQEDLSSDTDTLSVPKYPVTQLALAYALVERGEDGGLESSEAYAMFKDTLADHIAIESSRYIEEESWEAT